MKIMLLTVVRMGAVFLLITTVGTAMAESNHALEKSQKVLPEAVRPEASSQKYEKRDVDSYDYQHYQTLFSEEVTIPQASTLHAHNE